MLELVRFEDGLHFCEYDADDGFHVAPFAGYCKPSVEGNETHGLINGYLEELLLAQFKALVPTDDWSEDRADSFFEIGIGKTPPRKEPKWFSNDRKGNCVWLSIKDMAKSGAYSLDSTEYLTLDAVKQKNVRKVPEGSVLLSFKLTVGRVKIAACDMTTNEAIACFSSNDSRRLAYVYPYLLTYDYSKLGSTSSIATAVNSKTIKAMSITMPGDKELDSFYELSKPLYGQMLCIAKENAKLELLRDTLLPKLMSGEIDVSKIDLTQLNSHLSKCSSGPCCILPVMVALSATKWRISTKQSMMRTLASIAVSLRNTADSIEASCSVNIRGI